MLEKEIVIIVLSSQYCELSCENERFDPTDNDNFFFFFKITFARFIPSSSTTCQMEAIKCDW